MKSKKKVILAIAMKEELDQVFATLKDTSLLDDAEVSLVHIFESKIYPSEFAPLIYPLPDQIPAIKESILTYLDSLRDSLFDEKFQKKCQWGTTCLFSTHPKLEMEKLLKKTKAELLVVATEGKHGVAGLFHSSFAEYMVKHAPCPMLVLRGDSAQ